MNVQPRVCTIKDKILITTRDAPGEAPSPRRRPRPRRRRRHHTHRAAGTFRRKNKRQRNYSDNVYSHGVTTAGNMAGAARQAGRPLLLYVANLATCSEETFQVPSRTRRRAVFAAFLHDSFIPVKIHEREAPSAWSEGAAGEAAVCGAAPAGHGNLCWR